MVTPKKILIIQLKQLGDVLVSSVLGNNIKKAYPKVEIHYAVFDFAVPVLASNPNIDVILPFSEKGRYQIFKYVKRLWELRKQNYDLIIDCYAKWESVQLGIVLNPQELWGYRKTFRKLFYDRSFPLSSELYFGQGGAIDRRLVFTKGLNIHPDSIDAKPIIYLEGREIKEARGILIELGVDLSMPIYCMAPAAKRLRKRWPKSHFVAIAKRLLSADSQIQIYLNYGPSEKDYVQSIQAAINSKRVFMLQKETSLRLAASIFSLCNGFFGNDGGATHIGRAVGCPTFTIFSPITPTKMWAVQDDSDHPFISLEKCLSQSKYERLQIEISKENSAEFMALITPEMVWSSMKEWVLKTNKKGEA